ncbi:type II toxin-antitoxin system HipA family toxin YjjJ [Acidovorax sp. NCPPB 4044]|uniref:type II toxin-antitoxin system HipA family toxin YjjJ n=1 Tax=Acidovorax sp. NCPPB 4044 TaxID=2940490 RepID=UPI002304CF9E|nr:type II toxin-antitoxin system HipA family toxin YjjJ [Acidovorax sp. NCPPB 4044]MDA8522051.1 type II toxin-antitoxin system HipA family toxin YjjJ [Acidovorax sp. NCPPB 4044]
MHSDALRLALRQGPQTAQMLAGRLRVSQPTISRALAVLGDEVLRLGAARSIRYVLRDLARGHGAVPVHRVDAQGQTRSLGELLPVHPGGYVMRQDDGVLLHSDGLPWWMFDMRPQGYLGRAFLLRHGGALGLPPRLSDWSDADAMRALLAQGGESVGNLLLGDAAVHAFVHGPAPVPLPWADRAPAYAALADAAARGEAPGSSAGGEQPKFMACAETAAGPRHVLVKFTEAEHSPVSERWRDLLLAEHLALQVLQGADIPASRTTVLDHVGQRFLEVERFDRVGPTGRIGLFSLAALDAEFVGQGSGGWPSIVRALAQQRCVRPEAVEMAGRLWAFGTLIGNTDMHTGNLSFISEHGRPYALAPAYDMTPMAFAPRSGGGLPAAVPEPVIQPDVPARIWHGAVPLARRYLAALRGASGFSDRFAACVDALEAHVDTAAGRIARLA